MTDLEIQLLVKKIKDAVTPIFDDDLLALYPDPFNLEGIMKLQEIKTLKSIDTTLKRLLDEKEN